MSPMSSPAHSRYAFVYQPVLDERQASVAVELHYRLPPGVAQADPMLVANVIFGAFIHSGLDDLLRHRRVHVPANRALLASSLPLLLPADHVVFELDEDVTGDAEALAVCRTLKAQGFSFAWRDSAVLAIPGTWLELVDILKLDMRHVRASNFVSQLAALQQCPARLQACHVNRHEDFELARRSGFKLFQGYYFTHPQVVSGDRPDPDKLAVLDLLDKLAADADDPIIEAIFKDSPRLTLHLLRLVNSSAFSLHPPIRSLKHAFAILGRRPLERWLHILLFALDSTDGQASPLMELALRRARFMEYILRYRTHATSSLLQDESYLTGILSLADALMDWPMAKVVERLHVVQEVKVALLERRGPLGRLLQLCESLEAADFDGVETLAAQLQLSPEAVMHSQNVAMVWAHGMVEPREDAPALEEPDGDPLD